MEFASSRPVPIIFVQGILNLRLTYEGYPGNTIKGGQFDPSWFFEFPPKPSAICYLLMVRSMFRVDPTQNYEENTKNPIQDFLRFRYKNLLKFIF